MISKIGLIGANNCVFEGKKSNILNAMAAELTIAPEAQLDVDKVSKHRSWSSWTPEIFGTPPRLTSKNGA